MLGLTDSSETVPGVSSEISNAAIESVNRNRMLDFGKTTCKRIHPEPVIEKERSHSSEERHAGLLVGTWYYLIPDPSGALVSEVVDRKDLALERTHIPGHHFTPTGPTDGHNNESDCAMDDNVFLARSSDEVYPKHFSPDERVAFEIADSAEWKAIVDSGSVKVLDSEVANTIRKERPDRAINSRVVRRLKPQEGTFQKPKAKSRWCVLEHQDPDAADMFTYASTPQTESIKMSLFLLQLCSLTLSIADLENASCQTDSLDRSAGPLFVEPCEGLDLPSGSLIQLIAPVYGLNDLPFQVVLRSNCTLSQRLPYDHSIDAKSVFDALIKECAGNRRDRRAAVDLAIVREILKAQGSHIRWIPHALMLADSMTKADPSAGNDALRHLLRTGKLVWDEETIRQSAHLGRTKAVSRRQLETNGETLHGT